MESIFGLLSALKGQQRQMDTVANNLANVNTAGYKGDIALFREYYNEFAGQDLESEEERFAHDEFISPMMRGGTSYVMPDHVSPSMARGIYKHTGNAFDLAIQSDGYFVVETQQGLRYTRNGQFNRDSSGYLITGSGDKVLGENGPIRIDGDSFSVGENGRVMVDGNEVDVLRIAGFPEETRLSKLGNSYWAPSSTAQQPQKPDKVEVHQYTLEGSNVDTVQEMVKMINVNRSYEAAQKLLRSLDELDEQVISIAKV
jgi:flagellar basal-body rod protein FlgF